MKLVVDEAGLATLEARLDAAHDKSLEAIRSEIQRREANRTGRLDSSYQTSRAGDSGAVYSDAPYAGAVERGAWVRGGPGPHIRKGNRVLSSAGRHFGRYMSKFLRDGGG